MSRRWIIPLVAGNMVGECQTLTYKDAKIGTPSAVLNKQVLDAIPAPATSATLRDPVVNREWARVDSEHVTNHRDKNNCNTLVFDPVKVMSFNGLAKSLVDAKYQDNDEQVMAWEQRKLEILRVVEAAACDVVCLQEIDQCEYEQYFQEHFKRMGYESIYKKKNGYRQDGVCTLYSQKRFQLLFKEAINLASRDPNYDKVQVACIVALLDTFTRDLTGKEVADVFIVSNTHLLFNKNRGDVKLEQLCNLLVAVKDMEQRVLNHFKSEGDMNVVEESDMKVLKPAIVMCGDFNFTPQSFLYHFLANGYISLKKADAKRISGQYLMFDELYETNCVGHLASGVTVGNFKNNYIHEVHGSQEAVDGELALEQITSEKSLLQEPEWLKSSKTSIDSYLESIKAQDDARLLYCPFSLQSAYNCFDPSLQSTNEPAFTAFHGWQRGCIDYIWYSNENLAVEAIYEMPSYFEVKAHGNLPNKGWPSSDHFSLVSCLKRF